MSVIESNTREPTLHKTEAMGLRAPVRGDKAMCYIAVMILVLLVASSCSKSSEDSVESTCPPAPNGSGQLSEYFRGYIRYSHPYSDNVIPIRATLNSPTSTSVGAPLDNTVSKGVEDEDEFVMELRDALGRSLKSIKFYVQPAIYEYDADPDKPIPPPYKSAYFNIIVKKPIDYASITFLYEGNELETIEEHSANTPCLSVSWPTEDRAFDESDHILVSFEATDADEDELSYSIYYSANGGKLYGWKKTAVMQNSLSSVMISTASLKISDQARLAISVTDGKRSMVWESPIFTIAEQLSKPTPKAYDDSANGYVSEPLRIYVLDNDLYTSNASVKRSLKIAVPPALGATTVYNGTNGWVQTLRPYIEYTAESAGTDTLTYSICDSNNQCDSAQVTITSRVNQPPIANDDIVGGDIGEVLRIDVLANDIDTERDFDYESLSIDVPPIFGTASVKSEYTTWDREYFIEYYYASSAIDSLTYSICDTFDQCDTAEVTIKAGTADCAILGTEQDDTLRGTSDDDVICGLGGNDTIYAGGGNDIVRAGLGDDVVFAGAGDDTIYGEDGDDTIDSGAGDDIVRGSDGNDDITGGDGADQLYGGLGDDTLDGGDGDDIIHGSKGDDTIYGGPGDDTIRGNLGADIIYPGAGNDTLEGPTEPDTIIE